MNPQRDADADAIWFTSDDPKLIDSLRVYENDCSLLVPNPRRFVLFPIQYKLMWDHYKLVQHSFWTAEDLELNVEDVDVEVIAAHLRVVRALRSSNVVDALAGGLQAPEARCFFGFQGMLESIHVEALSAALLRIGGEDALTTYHDAPQPVSPQHAFDALVDSCADPLHAFVRRLVVYTAILAFRAATLEAAAKLWESPLLEKLYGDATRFAEFAAMVCRAIVPACGEEVEQLVFNAVAYCTRALPDMPRLQAGWRPLAEKCFLSIKQQPRPVSQPTSRVLSTADSGISTPTKPAENDFVFDTSEDF